LKRQELNLKESVIQGQKKLFKTSERIQEAQRLGTETEKVGNETILDLKYQREALVRARENVPPLHSPFNSISFRCLPSFFALLISGKDDHNNERYIMELRMGRKGHRDRRQHNQSATDSHCNGASNRYK
jgi:hypothetical protein